MSKHSDMVRQRQAEELAGERARQWKILGCVAAAALGLGFLGLWAMASGGGDSSSGRRETAERQRFEAVAAVLRKSGCEVSQSAAGSMRVVLPLSQAMSMTPREAQEMALMAYERLGSRVRVLTPAGQVLGEAP